MTVSGNRVTINLAGNLDPNKDHHPRLLPGAIQNLAGNAHAGFDSSATWNFITGAGPAPDPTPPASSPNDGPIPKAWMARFGRTEADRALDAIEVRMRAAPAAGAEVSLAGERIGSEAGPAPWSRSPTGRGVSALRLRLPGGVARVRRV